MAGLISTTMIELLRSVLGVDSTDFPDAKAYQYLNMGKWQLEGNLSLPTNTINTSFVTVASQADYTQVFPVDAILTLALQDDDLSELVPLDPISRDVYNAIHSTDPNLEDKPLYYLYENYTLTLEPTPSQVFTIKVQRKELLSDISSINTTIQMDNNLQEVLVWLAAEKAFGLEYRDFNSSQRAENTALTKLSMYVSRDAKEDKAKNKLRFTVVRSTYNPRGW